MKNCELCKFQAATYCESDQASLCWDCDSKVHGANFLVARHSRSLLCHVCQSITPWKASGEKLGQTISVCESCINGRQQQEEISDEDSNEISEDEEEEEEEEGENQVVPWSKVTSSPSPPPPPPSSSSSSSGYVSDSVNCCSSKRKHRETTVDGQSQEDDDDDPHCSSSQRKQRKTLPAEAASTGCIGRTRQFPRRVSAAEEIP